MPVPAQRLLILGWDAADWQVIDPLLARGQMPNLARLVAAGTRADLRTLEPKLSPILWSTIATGKTADKHGILNFVEPNPSGEGVRVTSSTTRRTKALWNMLTQRGLRVNVVGWYASHPAEPINGTCVSNLLMEHMPEAPGTPWPVMDGLVHAAGEGGTERAARIAAARVRTADIGRDALRELLPNVARASRGDTRPATLAKEFARMRSLHGAALEALRGDAWDCAMVFHDTIDTIGHHFMEYRAPRMPHVKAADLRVYGDVMDCVYRAHDRLLGELLAVCGDGVSVILVSDHGFHSGADRPVILDVTKEERAALESRWHRQFGVAVFSGPGFRAGERIGAPTLLDIAPTALAALGLPVGQDMDGRVVSEAFAMPLPVQTVPSWDTEPGDAGLHPPQMRQDPFEAADALRQLIDLGYMADTGADQQRLLELVRRESNFNLAVACMTTARPEKAVPLLRALAEELPNDVRYRSVLAQCEFVAGEHAACMASIDRWQALAPTADEPLALRVPVLLALGRRIEALAALDAAEAAMGSDAAHARTLADLCALAGRWPESAAHAARAIAHAPAAPEPHVAAARAALELGDFEAAGEHAMDATERAMAIPEAHYVLGAALAWGGELEHAATSLGIALQFGPGHGAALRMAAAVARARGDAALAAELAARPVNPALDPPVQSSARGAEAWEASRRA
jgi:tetratricopeptide (TPR) repeat protein